MGLAIVHMHTDSSEFEIKWKIIQRTSTQHQGWVKLYEDLSRRFAIMIFMTIQRTMFYQCMQLVQAAAFIGEMKNEGHFTSFFSNELLSLVTDNLIQRVNLLIQGANSSSSSSFIVQ